jgi:hypothetical protein
MYVPQEVLLYAGARAGHQLTQIVMEYCDKGSLMHAIKKGLFLASSRWGPHLALRALLRTAQEVAQGMLHLHQANVIHGGERFCDQESQKARWWVLSIPVRVVFRPPHPDGDTFWLCTD